MNKKTRIITISAILTALTVVCLYISALFPTGKPGIVAAASLFAAASVIETGLKPGIAVYTISSALGIIILPDKTPLLIYILFFGYYPIVKSVIERLGNPLIEWILKLLVFNAALTAAWFGLREIIFGYSGTKINALLLYIGGSAVFVLFDFGFTKLIWFYINQVSKYIKR